MVIGLGHGSEPQRVKIVSLHYFLVTSFAIALHKAWLTYIQKFILPLYVPLKNSYFSAGNFSRFWEVELLRVYLFLDNFITISPINYALFPLFPFKSHNTWRNNIKGYPLWKFNNWKGFFQYNNLFCYIMWIFSHISLPLQNFI